MTRGTLRRDAIGEAGLRIRTFKHTRSRARPKSMLTAWVIPAYADTACVVALLAIPREQLLIRTFATVIPAYLVIVGFLYRKYGLSLPLCVDVLTSIGVLAQFLVPSLYPVSIELKGQYAWAFLDYIDYFPDVAAVALIGQTLLFLG